MSAGAGGLLALGTGNCQLRRNKANRSDETRILITNDKHFGEKVYRDGRSHCGVVLLRLDDERPSAKIEIMSRLMDLYADKLDGAFIVVSEQRIKIGKPRR